MIHSTAHRFNVTISQMATAFSGAIRMPLSWGLHIYPLQTHAGVQLPQKHIEKEKSQGLTRPRGTHPQRQDRCWCIREMFAPPWPRVFLPDLLPWDDAARSPLLNALKQLLQFERPSFQNNGPLHVYSLFMAQSKALRSSTDRLKPCLITQQSSFLKSSMRPLCIFLKVYITMLFTVLDHMLI